MPDHLEVSGQTRDTLGFLDKLFYIPGSLYMSFFPALGILSQLVSLPPEIVHLEHHFILRTRPGHTTVVTIVCLSSLLGCELFEGR